MEREHLWEITLGDLLDQQAARYPDQDCLVFNDRLFRATYSEFRDKVNETARGLLALGIKPGDHVAIWATNVPEWMLTMWATAKIGAVMVTMNTSYKVFEAEYLLRQSDTQTLIMTEGFKDSHYVEIIESLIPELQGAQPGTWQSATLPVLQNIIVIGDTKHDGMLAWNDMVAAGANVTAAELSKVQASLHWDDVINMQYTSGTTGFAKGVMLSHYNILNNGLTIGDNLRFTTADRLCIPVPMFHCFGMVLAVLACMTHGSAMVMVEYFSPSKVLKAVHEEKCTALHGVPTMFITMLDHPAIKGVDFSHMRTGIMAGSPCPVQIMNRVVSEMNIRELTIVYGLTESSPGCTMTRTDDSLERRVSTVGRTLPFMETKVVNTDTGELCAPHEPGEFMVRGYNVMKGYYKNDEATENAITSDGWLHTGDLATVDEHGYYNITGRIKDCIIRGGENIYPKEIEECLYTHPGVQDVQVIGVPSIQYGEEIMAYIIPKSGANLTVEGVREFLKERIAKQKVPSYVAFVTEFPMTASGKIQKFKLRDQAVKDLHLEQADSIETA
jgi:fatty-acyl-CoA synthase